MDLRNIIRHVRDREYMSGIERNNLRIKATGEVFTPTELVIIILDRIPQDQFLLENNKTFIDPTCGDGQFLSEVLIRKLEMISKKNNSFQISDDDFKKVLETIYGVDLMIDNVDLCRERLLCGREDLRHIVEQNIQCKDALKYGYTFKPMGPARKKIEEKARIRQTRIKAKQKEKTKLEEKKKKKEAQQKKLFGEILTESV